MTELRVTVDTRQLKRALVKLGEKAPAAIMRAVNRTARTARTQAVRAVAKEIRLPQKDVRPMLPVIPATPRLLEAKLLARGRPISLMRLGARQTKQGVVYRGPGGPDLDPVGLHRDDAPREAPLGLETGREAPPADHQAGRSLRASGRPGEGHLRGRPG